MSPCSQAGNQLELLAAAGGSRMSSKIILMGQGRASSMAVAPYPALDRFYFSPLKLYEYLAMGKAVVASAIGQVCEVIDDGINGLLTRPGDAGDLAEKLERLYRDPELRQRSIADH